MSDESQIPATPSVSRPDVDAVFKHVQATQEPKPRERR